jgi:hypothetical protein
MGGKTSLNYKKGNPMKIIKPFTASILTLTLVATAFAGIGSHQAVYHGGTIDLKDGAEGSLALNDQTVAVFQSKGTSVRIPYAAITSIEYGQKAGRRVGAAIATTILVTPVGLALLLSHKRRHIVTLAWTVDGKNEAAVFELGKSAIRPALVSLEARTGKKIEWESPDARKNLGL